MINDTSHNVNITCIDILHDNLYFNITFSVSVFFECYLRTHSKCSLSAYYSRGSINSVKTLGAYIFHNKAGNPINRDAKSKPLICTF